MPKLLLRLENWLGSMRWNGCRREGRNIKAEQDKRLFQTLKVMEKIVGDTQYLYRSERERDDGGDQGIVRIESAHASEILDEAHSQGCSDTDILDDGTTSLLFVNGTSTGAQICQRSVRLPEKRARPPPYLELEDGLQNHTYTDQNQAAMEVIHSGELSHADMLHFQPCCLLILSFGAFIALSCFLGVFFTMKEEYSMGDAFTLASYVIAIGGLVSTGALAYHYPRCKCWKMGGNKEQELVELNILRC